MQLVNMHLAKSNLSRLAEAIEQGEEQEIIIARNGKPAARFVPLSNSLLGPRLSVTKDAFVVQANNDADNEQVAHLLLGELSH